MKPQRWNDNLYTNISGLETILSKLSKQQGKERVYLRAKVKEKKKKNEV